MNALLKLDAYMFRGGSRHTSQLELLIRLDMNTSIDMQIIFLICYHQNINLKELF
jgi:hypothetical protein